MQNPSINPQPGNPKQGGGGGALVLVSRLTWFLFGPAALFFILAGIVLSGSGWTTHLDAAFAVVVGLMLLSRWIDQRSGSATTTTGEPATPIHFRHYLAGLPLVTLGLWVSANFIGNHVLAGGP